MKTQHTESVEYQIARNAVRWMNNILVEVLSQHGEALPDADREHLRTAVDALSSFGHKEEGR